MVRRGRDGANAGSRPARAAPPRLILRNTSARPTDKMGCCGDSAPALVACFRQAAARGQLEVVRFLVEAGAAVDQRGTSRELTPLDAARRAGHLDVVRFFEEMASSGH